MIHDKCSLSSENVFFLEEFYYFTPHLVELCGSVGSGVGTPPVHQRPSPHHLLSGDDRPPAVGTEPGPVWPGDDWAAAGHGVLPGVAGGADQLPSSPLAGRAALQHPPAGAAAEAGGVVDSGPGSSSLCQEDLPPTPYTHVRVVLRGGNGVGLHVGPDEDLVEFWRGPGLPSQALPTEHLPSWAGVGGGGVQQTVAPAAFEAGPVVAPDPLRLEHREPTAQAGDLPRPRPQGPGRARPQGLGPLVAEEDGVAGLAVHLPVLGLEHGGGLQTRLAEVAGETRPVVKDYKILGYEEMTYPESVWEYEKEE